METYADVAREEAATRTVDQALGGGRPWWQACCLGCGIFLFALLVTGAWFVHSLKGPGMQQLSALPANLPSDIRLYRPEVARSIRYIPAAQKRGLAERVLSPLRLLGLVASGTADLAPPEVQGVMSRFASSTAGLDGVNVFAVDTLYVDWGPMPEVRMADVIEHYRATFSAAGFSLQTGQGEATRMYMLFGERSTATVQVDVKAGEGDRGIDEIRAVVNYVGQ